MDRQTAEIIASLTMEGHADKASEIIEAAGGYSDSFGGKKQKRGQRVVETWQKKFLRDLLAHGDLRIPVNPEDVGKYQAELQDAADQLCEVLTKIEESPLAQRNRAKRSKEFAAYEKKRNKAVQRGLRV